MDTALKLHGSGGWPLTIFATPEGSPFFTATYIPKRSQPGRAGLLDILPETERLWKEVRLRVLASAGAIVKAIDGTYSESSFRSGDFPRTRLAETFGRLCDVFDPVWGGFGFHRYATDRQWRVPHFEKMLYDQGQLILLFINAFDLTGKTEFEKTAREIIEFCFRELRSPEGGFYSALDTESEGGEGSYSLWSRREFVEILERMIGEEKAATVADHFGLRDEGNWSDPVNGERMPSNIIYCSPGSSINEISPDWEELRRVLLSRRNERRAPSTDDKILTDWNALMLRALARAARVLKDSSLLRTAVEPEEFLRKKLGRTDGRLFHSYLSAEKGAYDEREIIIVGDGVESEKMLQEIDSLFLPRTVVLKKDSANEKMLSRCAPFIYGYHAFEETGAAA